MIRKKDMWIVFIVFISILHLVCYNDIYIRKDDISVERFYYNRLSLREKIVYRKIEKSVSGYKKSFNLNIIKISNKDINKIMTTYFFENPNQFHLSKSYEVDVNKNDIVSKVYLNYELTKEEYEYMIGEVTDKLSLIEEITKDMTNAEKSEYVYKYLTMNNNYHKNGMLLNSVYGSVVLGKANCEGMSSGYMYIMNKLNVPTFQALGQIEVNENKENHSWNITYINNEFRYTDPTFGMSLINSYGEVKDDRFYDYLNMNCEESLTERDISIQNSLFGVYCME